MLGSQAPGPSPHIGPCGYWFAPQPSRRTPGRKAKPGEKPPTAKKPPSRSSHFNPKRRRRRAAQTQMRADRPNPKGALATFRLFREDVISVACARMSGPLRQREPANSDPPSTGRGAGQDVQPKAEQDS